MTLAIRNAPLGVARGGLSSAEGRNAEFGISSECGVRNAPLDEARGGLSVVEGRT
jgi:hypothetical protein